jgi:hypothetical protein
VLAGGDSISGEGEGGYVFDYVVLGLLLSGSEMVLDTLLLHAGSLSLQLLDALDLEIWCWILGKPTVQLELGVRLCGGSAMFDDVRDCFGWWFDEEYCDGEVLLW